MVANIPGLLIDWAHPINRGCVGWWPLNEGAGRRAIDLTGYGNGLLTNDPSWTGGAIGAAAKFDGSNDYVNIAHDPRHQFSTQLTFSAWVCPTSGTAYPPLLSKTNGAGDGYSWEFNNGGVESSISLWRHAGGWGSNGYTTITNAVWSHVAVAMNGATERCYVNGVLANSYASTVTIAASTVALQICGSASLSRYGGGSVAHVRVYNRGLNPAEIHQLYAEPLAGARPLFSAARTFVAIPRPKSADRLHNRSFNRIYKRGES